MSHAPHAENHAADADVAESIVSYIPWLLPAAGAVLIFLLAFIAVFMT